MLKMFFMTLTLLSSSLVAAEEYNIGQKSQSFTESELLIKQGDVVKFINHDDIFHNVFSLSDSKMFDLGSFPKGEYRDVTFEEKGEVEVECAIHPNMKMTIIVE